MKQITFWKKCTIISFILNSSFWIKWVNNKKVSFIGLNSSRIFFSCRSKFIQQNLNLSRDIQISYITILFSKQLEHRDEASYWLLKEICAISADWSKYAFSSTFLFLFSITFLLVVLNLEQNLKNYFHFIITPNLPLKIFFL